MVQQMGFWNRRSCFGVLVLGVVAFLLLGIPSSGLPAQSKAARDWTWRNPRPAGDRLLQVWGGSGSDVFAVGHSGTILHYNGTSWSAMSSISAADAETMAGWSGGLAVDFGALGFWNWNGSVLTQLTPGNPDTMAGWAGGLAADFGAPGLWNTNGSGWSQLTGGNADGLSGVDF